MKPHKVALVYDRVNTFGGAERVLIALKKVFPDADIFTSVSSVKHAQWAADWNVKTSFLQYIPLFRTHHQLLGMLMPIAFESFDFSDYSLVISVTSEAAKGIITKPSTLHVCYLLTPTRYLWSHAKEYEKDYYKGIKKFLLPLHRIVLSGLRRWDRVASMRPDIIVPISHVVKERCEKYYARTCETVVYPPVGTELFKKENQLATKGAQYLCVGRLVPYKRIDLVIQACLDTGRELKIIGMGPDMKRLKQVAGSSPLIHFLGHVSEQELVHEYQACKSVVFPGEEDFGIVALEAMAAGRPVIVYSRGGAAEVVRHGLTGVVMMEQNRRALFKAFEQIEKTTWDSRLLQKEAEKYNEQNFMKYWRKYL